MGSLPKSIQELDPKLARFCLNIEKFGKQKSGKNFAAFPMLVGVSGGIDSTALLIIATLLARKSGGRVFCAHVDHGLREESAGDRIFVEDLCAMLDVPVEPLAADVAGYAAKNSMGLEEAGRIIRYDFFNQCLKKFKAEYLLLAHHVGDLSEDIVMRLIRGTGWPALAGMIAYDPKRKLLRPLLSTKKEDLENFLRSIGCPWREDESNHSDDYTRNRLRNNIMPLLNAENPNLGAGLIRLKNQAELDETYWDEKIADVSEYIESGENGEIFLPCSILNKCHSALRLRIYKKILDGLGPGHALFDSIMQLDRAFSARKSGSTFQFPGNKVVKVNKAGLLFNIN
ncbi:tRNA lysidine(34) synthetase TilS [Desulfovibrio sp. JC022]|uniref:tRNA lysidine(34) synthetase TilS n=1 Tax=Desulfovibrio sp. JC022 TaxID=2593642 RepID=UPI0013D75432|nr:tRNA lysidine(34) synthetase TilS [Desulfovibrio sp. JC022]NDV24503.1 tRNA lysidine(34) synthetase TilS [Desulfovibrio sp. JC022]